MILAPGASAAADDAGASDQRRPPYANRSSSVVGASPSARSGKKSSLDRLSGTKTDGSRHDLRVRATIRFRKLDGGWKVAHDEEPMAEAKTWTGGCHCGRVRYEVTTDLGRVIECNCSICAKTGALLTFAPADRFRLLAGEESLTDYQFGKKRIHHLFCSHCGIRSFARGTGPDGAPMVAINIRCLDGVEPSQLTVTPFDGRSL